MAGSNHTGKRGLSMQYREFGNTGVKLSTLGFGAMRLPQDEDEAIRVMHRAFDLGVNYIDTAPGYGESEIKVGKALASYPHRDGVHLSTKNPLEDDTATGWRSRLERSLERLQVDHIHFYQSVHGINWKAFEENFSKSGALKEAQKAREEGLIGHICFSFHDSAENLVRLIDTGEFQGFTAQYNLLDRSLEDALAYARDRGMGVIVMGPVGGGRLVAPSENISRVMGQEGSSTPHIAIRFVLAHSAVTVALSGMSTMEMVEANVRTASDASALTDAEWQRVLDGAAELKKMEELYCTGCGYCTPCPHDVNIPENFRLMNLYRVWGQEESARWAYSKIGKGHIPGKPASECTQCRECETKCPQHIPIVEQLEATARALGEQA